MRSGIYDITGMTYQDGVLTIVNNQGTLTTLGPVEVTQVVMTPRIVEGESNLMIGLHTPDKIVGYTFQITAYAEPGPDEYIYQVITHEAAADE